ncbi:MAG TPA: JAB domain-containing protein [Candidatus Acetothermia bacterium]|nr:JAB domain-containing protein [Candidatus Acetothermia bacterium]
MARKRIRALPGFSRPREKLLERGPQALSDAELLAILLRTGVEGKSALDLAKTILEKAGPELPRWSVEDLRKLTGIGKAKACQIVAAFELARRYLLGERPRIREPQDVLPYVQPYVRRKQEYFVCITLNGAGEVIQTRVVTVGLLDSSQVHPREVFADAIADRAAAVILAHNHPSGSLEPSPEDIAITRRLVQAGEILGIPVLDHIIVGPAGYLSLKERHLL